VNRPDFTNFVDFPSAFDGFIACEPVLELDWKNFPVELNNTVPLNIDVPLKLFVETISLLLLMKYEKSTSSDADIFSDSPNITVFEKRLVSLIDTVLEK
jgi:hypothetical protein